MGLMERCPIQNHLTHDLMIVNRAFAKKLAGTQPVQKKGDTDSWEKKGLKKWKRKNLMSMNHVEATRALTNLALFE